MGHLGAEIEFLSFHRKWWKFARPPRIWIPARILACRAGTTSWYSTGETSPIKAERPELGSHLGSTCLRGNTSMRIWTRALQPDQEEVSSCRFRRAQIVSERQTFPPIFWLGAEIFARRGDFNARQDSIVRLYFYQTPIFCIPAEILGCTYNTRQCFGHPPIFQASANISGFRQYFHETPRF